VLAAAVALLLILIWPRLRGRGESSGSADATGAALPTLAQQRAVERDMQSLMHELSEMARKVGAQLDSRAARLEALIRAADQRLAQLEQPREHSNGHAAAPPTSRDDRPPRPTGPGATPTPAAEMDPRHVQIYAMLDEGLTANQIAERLGRPEGEVELIIALRPGVSRTAY
jgi:hypothetical protein